jgi:hypothetical protein
MISSETKSTQWSKANETNVTYKSIDSQQILT